MRIVKFSNSVVERWGIKLLMAATLGLLASTGAAQSVAPPPQIVAKYSRSPTPGALRIANTVPRSNCGRVTGVEKCRENGLVPLDETGDVTKEGEQSMKRLLNYPLNPTESEAITLPVLLVKLLVHLSDTFGGKQICIVSGFRCFQQGGKKCHEFQNENSRHITGSAADIVLLGVDAVDLASYALFLNQTHPEFMGKLGVGYYPNQEHVHVDVRDKHKYWVDYSAGGTQPQHDPTHPSPVEAFHKYYDPKIAPPRPGGQCPVLEEQLTEGNDAKVEAVDLGSYRWRNVLYTEPPLRGSVDYRHAFQTKNINFQIVPVLKDLGALK